MRHLINKHYVSKLIGIAALAVLLSVAFVPSPAADANSISELQDRIDELNQEVEQSEDALNDISQRADTLENKLAILRAQIAGFQSRIDQTNLKIEKIQKELKQAEERLARQKEILAENVRTLYKEGDVSTVEVLASSDNFSDFVNRQEYLESVKIGIQEAAKEVVALTKELEAKEKEQKDLLAQLKSQKSLLASKRNEQSTLLAETRGQEARYQDIVQSKKAELKRLMEEQAALIAASQSGGNIIDANTNYPYIHSDCFDSDGSFNGMRSPSPCDEHVDPWGFYYQQCVSYAAWRRSDLGMALDGPWGNMYYPANARDWVNIARSRGYSVDSVPLFKGAIAVNTSGNWGHVAIVEKINNNGTIDISQFNANLNGRFSYVAGVPVTAFSHYIHNK